ncbi:MAG: hypothetical protein WDM85_01970 [Caulobacteraceae bacterium]
MPQGFQQQSSDRNLNFSKSAPAPQHGAKGDRAALKREEQRSFAPKIPQH